MVVPSICGVGDRPLVWRDACGLLTAVKGCCGLKIAVLLVGKVCIVEHEQRGRHRSLLLNTNR